MNNTPNDIISILDKLLNLEGLCRIPELSSKWTEFTRLKYTYQDLQQDTLAAYLKATEVGIILLQETRKHFTQEQINEAVGLKVP